MRPLHICIIQPAGYVHSLGFLDQARYLRFQFRRLGAQVSLSKNRLQHGAVNIVLGAHLGFDAQLKSRYACVFFNLEQIGQGGAAVSKEYLHLLANSAVLDYDRDNVGNYTAHVDDVPLLSFGYAPYLEPSPIALADRPIDLLFIGSMNERRQKIIAEIESTGLQVAMLDAPLYGPERDQIIGQCKAVINCHFYETARFEQARVFQCLSLGTPVISERLANTQPPAQFEDAVFWVQEGQWKAFIEQHFRHADFAARAQEKIAQFATHDTVEAYADALAFAQSFANAHCDHIGSAPWLPQCLHIGSGKDYLMGWLNVDISAKALPDVLLDLSQEHAWPLTLPSTSVGEVVLNAGQLKLIYANNVLEHVHDLPQLMGNCLDLLEEDGIFQVMVPYEHANTAWQDPTHVRAMNEDSWQYYTDWFWYLGWFEHRFHVQEFGYLGKDLQDCERSQAHFMKVSLIKKATTLSERMTARMQQANFGGVPEDALFEPLD